MRVSHRIEMILLSRRRLSVRELSRALHLNEDRCRAELAELEPFGVKVENGTAFIAADQDAVPASLRLAA
jgi:hypothetical protein